VPKIEKNTFFSIFGKGTDNKRFFLVKALVLIQFYWISKGLQKRLKISNRKSSIDVKTQVLVAKNCQKFRFVAFAKN
jgi:hypothetical protein